MSLVCFAHPCKTRRGYAKIKLQRNILRSTLRPYTKLTKSMRKGVLKFSWKNKYQGSSLFHMPMQKDETLKLTKVLCTRFEMP